MKKDNSPIVGVMGPATTSQEEWDQAFKLGELIAKEGWILLSGGRNCGVMDAASQGSKASGGLTIGILPGEDKRQASPAIDIPILTGMGSARNQINILSSDAIVAIGGHSLGTISEIALALKADKHVILLQANAECIALFRKIRPDRASCAASPKEAVQRIDSLLKP